MYWCERCLAGFQYVAQDSQHYRKLCDIDINYFAVLAFPTTYGCDWIISHIS